MLVIAMSEDEQIVFRTQDGTEIVVVPHKANKLSRRIAIDAPKTVTVERRKIEKEAA